MSLVASPRLLGTQEALRQVQQRENQQAHCNFIAHCVKPSRRAGKINDRPLVLSGNGEIYLDTGDNGGHRVAGNFLPYPGKSYEGLVTTTLEDASTLNWIYVDAKTHQLKYGLPKDTATILPGPFDCTMQSHRLTFQAWEGFCAVEVQPEIWAIYFDINDDGLKTKVPRGTRVLEIGLEKRESEDGALAMPQTILLRTECEETEEKFSEEASFASHDEVDGERTTHTETNTLRTELERRERRFSEEVIVTFPGSLLDGDGLPVDTQLLPILETEEETIERFIEEEVNEVSHVNLTAIPEEDFIATPTPGLDVIDRLEADLIAMLECSSQLSSVSAASNGNAGMRSESNVSLHTDASSPPDLAPKSSSPIPIEPLALDPTPPQRPKTPEPKHHDDEYPPDSASSVAFVHSPTTYQWFPGSPRRTGRRPTTAITYRPSRIMLDADELSAIEDLSRSMDFSRPLSLTLNADIWGAEAPKDSVLHKISRKMSKGVNNAKSCVLGIRLRRSDGVGVKGAGGEKNQGRGRSRRHSTWN